MLVKDVEEDIKKYSSLVYRTAISILKTKHDSEDIYQNVFIKLYEYKKEFDSEEHKKAWLIKVTINECKSLLRRSWFKNREELDENLIFYENNEDSVLEEVEKLSFKYRVVVYLFYYEKYKECEISKNFIDYQ